jgi:hypothetical protein
MQSVWKILCLPVKIVPAFNGAPAVSSHAFAPGAPLLDNAQKRCFRLAPVSAVLHVLLLSREDQQTHCRSRDWGTCLCPRSHSPPVSAAVMAVSGFCVELVACAHGDASRGRVRWNEPSIWSRRGSGPHPTRCPSFAISTSNKDGVHGQSSPTPRPSESRAVSVPVAQNSGEGGCNDIILVTGTRSLSR